MWPGNATCVWLRLPTLSVATEATARRTAAALSNGRQKMAARHVDSCPPSLNMNAGSCVHGFSGFVRKSSPYISGPSKNAF